MYTKKQREEEKERERKKSFAGALSSGASYTKLYDDTAYKKKNLYEWASRIFCFFAVVAAAAAKSRIKKRETGERLLKRF